MRLLKAIERQFKDDYNVGSFIRSLRICNEIKGVELAEKLGISRRAKEIAEAMWLESDLFIKLAVKDSLKRQGIEVETFRLKIKKEDV